MKNPSCPPVLPRPPVTNANDMTPGSLRQGIILSSSNGKIAFDSLREGQMNTLTSGQLVTLKNLARGNLLTVKRGPTAAVGRQSSESSIIRSA